MEGGVEEEEQSSFRIEGSHDLHVRKIAWDIAVALILRDRLFPRRWIRRSCFEVRGRRPAREKPDVDIAAGPFHGNDTASVRVEVSAVGIGVLVLNVAAGIA